MTTFKTQLQMRKAFTQSFTPVVIDGVICESQKDVDKLESRRNHARRNTLTTRAYAK